VGTCLQNVLNTSVCGHMRLEHSEQYCSLDTWVQKPINLSPWITCVRKIPITSYCGCMCSLHTARFVVWVRAFGKCQSLCTVDVCVHYILHALSCGYVRSENTSHFVLWMYVFITYCTLCRVGRAFGEYVPRLHLCWIYWTFGSADTSVHTTLYLTMYSEHTEKPVRRIHVFICFWIFFPVRLY
jgi:hypothetical protein